MSVGARSFAALAALVASFCVEASATVYRCGNAYADVPCPRATVIDADDPRSAADRAAAREVALHDAALAARMAAERESAERLLRPAPPLRVRAPARAASSALSVAAARRSSRDRVRLDAEGNFIAVVPRKR